MPTDDVLARYELHLRRRDRRPRTIRAYVFALGAWLEERPDWRTVDALTVEQWLDTRSLGPAARRWWGSVLRGFYGWAMDAGELGDGDDRAVRRLATPRRPDYRPRPVAPADVVMALELAGGPLRVALALMVYGGLRCCEAAQLTWASVDVSARALYIEGKGGRIRWLPMHPALVGELGDSGRPGEPVIGARWSPSWLSTKVQRHLVGVGVIATAHQLRHSFATAGYDTRRDILAVSRLLGHRSVSTTMVYVDVDEERLRATVDSITYEDR